MYKRQMPYGFVFALDHSVLIYMYGACDLPVTLKKEYVRNSSSNPTLIWCLTLILLMKEFILSACDKRHQEATLSSVNVDICFLLDVAERRATK